MIEKLRKISECIDDIQYMNKQAINNVKTSHDIVQSFYVVLYVFFSMNRWPKLRIQFDSGKK